MEHINLKGEFNVRIKYFLIMLFITLQINAQNSQVTWSSFNMGYASSTTSNTTLKSIAGQSFVGNTKFSNNFIECGFLVDTLFRSVMVGVQEGPEMPTHFELYQNYPNPFNPTTTIRYDLPTASHVVMKVFNILGQEVAVLINEEKPAGKHQVDFNSTKLASGVYFYKLVAGEFVSVKKFLLLK